MVMTFVNGSMKIPDYSLSSLPAANHNEQTKFLTQIQMNQKEDTLSYTQDWKNAPIKRYVARRRIPSVNANSSTKVNTVDEEYAYVNKYQSPIITMTKISPRNFKSPRISEHTCRLCLKYKDNMTSLFLGDRAKSGLRNFLIEFSSIEVRQDDPLPKVICNECRSKLISAWSFRTQCQKADKELRKFHRLPESDYSFSNLETSSKGEEKFDDFITSDHEGEESLYQTVKQEKEELDDEEEEEEEAEEEEKLEFEQEGVMQEIIEEKEELEREEVRVDGKEELEEEEEQLLDFDLCNSSFKDEDDMENHTDVEKVEEPETSNKIYLQKDDNIIMENGDFIKENENFNTDIENTYVDEESREGNVTYFLESFAQELNNEIEYLENDPPPEDVVKIEGSQIEDEYLVTEKQSKKRKTEKIIDRKPVEKGTFLCHMCPRVFTTKGFLERHAKVHLRERFFACETCGKVFKTEEKLNVHNRVHDTTKRFECEVCGLKYVYEYLLNSHLRLHGRGKPLSTAKNFLCEICSKSFASQSGLKHHQQLHMDLKPYKCKFCDKTFATQIYRKKHEVRHSTDRQFKCHLCPATYISNNGLTNHLLLHTGEAHYHCDTCGKSFRRRKYLNEHIFTHTGEKPYACKMCGISYANSGSLFAHQKRCRIQFMDEITAPIIEEIVTDC